MAVEIMAEAGIELKGQRAKLLDEVPWREMDTIVSLCASMVAVRPPA